MVILSLYVTSLVFLLRFYSEQYLNYSVCFIYFSTFHSFINCF